ncbi:MAG: 1-(5-phosphoribosyl)-5-[(5-phosphoribosylamino)methylideneamino]imidazole-4-carboxamide isomerase [Spirochaetia bacterium]|nr:1-(5-phosphoribosyl)-5-[(5-phosphoribosylamino)methylideneamino]imidazole-4-carboxamide isomerase [Spirochaetia bacterium]
MHIIPAIDIIDGSCVRLTEGNYDAKTHYSDNPLEMAKSFEDAGCKFLHLVDLDGARKGSIVNQSVIEKIATHTSLHIDVGGGIQSRIDVVRVFESGAHEVTIGSLAVNDRELTQSLLEEFGSERLILGADCKDGYISIGGWKERTNVRVEDFVTSYIHSGFRKIISTDISKDGMLQGPSFSLYKKLLGCSNTIKGVKIVASGGVSSMQDIRALKELNLDGVIIGKALYEHYISLNELTEYMKSGDPYVS